MNITEAGIPDDEYRTTSTYIFYIAIACACGVILLVAFAVALYYMRSKKPSSTDRLRYLHIML